MKFGSDSNRTGPFVALFLCVGARFDVRRSTFDDTRSWFKRFVQRLTSNVRGIGAGFLLVLLTACQPTQEIHRYAGSVMGTTYHVSVVATANQRPEDLDQQIQATLDRIDSLMSTYKPDSELSRFNDQPANQAVEVSAELAAVLTVSVNVYQLSDGAFDPTVGPLVELWGFGAADTGDQLPDRQQIKVALAEMGFDAVHLEGRTLSKHRSVRLDLSAVAKGYAADQVSELLTSLDLNNHLVEVGGEMRLSGLKPDGEKWRIGIERPELAHTGAQIAVALTDVSVATSGDYRNYFEQDGVRYSHTIDPRTGYPVTHRLASVTVIADNTAMADALATAFMVLGEEQSLVIAEQLHMPLYMLVKTDNGFVERYSAAFKPYLTVN